MGRLPCEGNTQDRERCATSEAVGLASDGAYELPINQEQLADALGTTSVHVNRTLKGLEADGVIERRKRTVAVPS
ncbi:helix-turn-helix domain-containing protein [Brevundimonas bacteroides]|uniref:helix-turn-helix domain-containing protein n=1 Tax=Brevundimonas bacteroides TaxID=74311 RepID=UPI000A05D4A2